MFKDAASRPFKAGQGRPGFANQSNLATPLPKPIYALIAAAAACVFAIDAFTPLGVAVWVLYLVPILLSFFSPHRLAPLILGTIVTVLVAIGFALSAPGASFTIAAVNRGLGLAAIWAVAAAGYAVINGKHAMQRLEWLQSVKLGLNEQMAGELTTSQVSEAVLRYLAEHFGAQVGTMFVRDGEVFRCTATYAVPDECSVPSEIGPGEGLAGQAIKEGQATLIRDIPQGYLRFGSALGGGQPGSILVAPLASDGQVNAVVEFGFVGDVGGAPLELMRRASGPMAIAIRSAEYRSRLQDLLLETQRQAGELQKQSEELRVANEELQREHSELEASQAALERQQNELEQANAQLEDRNKMLEAQRAELQRSEVVLQAKSRELEQASRYKSEFLANMSHELRTPLNSALIMARLLADNRAGNLSDEQVRYAETIESSGNDLLTLINDILDLSKIEAGRVEVQPESIQLSEVLEKLRRSFEPMAQERGLAFRTEIATGTPPAIKTDPQRLEQILKNFVSNAIKFTETGEIAVEMDALPNGRIAISVRDTGIGIAPEQQDVIFEAFSQADGTTARRYGGTGLGLSISRELARLLGGQIELISAPGRGSTFTLVLPSVYEAVETSPRDTQVRAASTARDVVARSRPAPVRTPAALPSPETLTAPSWPAGAIEDDREALTRESRIILVVEDDPNFSRILRDLARERGFHCLLARTADQGVALARHYLPHAIVLDLGLPDHSGLSVLDRLKHDTRTRHIPVHVVSAQNIGHKALSLGAVGYLMKPVSHDRLTEAFQQIEQRLDRKVRRVLVVEDDANQSEAIRSLLASEGVEAEGVRTGAACLERLAAVTYDCMVLDLSLPDMSGFELLDRLSAGDMRSFPPVVVYTGKDLRPEDELRLRRYSSSIIVKGVKSPDRLLDEVTLFLHQVVSDLPDRQQRALSRALNRDTMLEGRRILIAEDDVRNVFALAGILEPHGASLEIARNGREALAALDQAEASGAPVDLVLMDVMMPEMDGLSATRKIRTRATWRNLPIIALTAKAMLDDQKQCLDAGANDYMAKPLDVEKLLSLVRVWLARG